jgi:hypothetical protein
MTNSAYDINVMLGTIGWGTDTLAARLGGVNKRTVERWRQRPDECPGNVVEWLARLAFAHETWALPIGWELVQ